MIYSCVSVDMANVYGSVISTQSLQYRVSSSVKNPNKIKKTKSHLVL